MPCCAAAPCYRAGQIPRWGPTRGPNSAARAAVAPLTRVGEAQDIANGVLFLCADAADYITAQELVIDGGMTAGGRPSRP